MLECPWTCPNIFVKRKDWMDHWTIKKGCPFALYDTKHLCLEREREMNLSLSRSQGRVHPWSKIVGLAWLEGESR